MLPLLLGLSLLAAPVAHASDNASSAAAALKILTQPHEASHEAPSAAPARQTITIERSETLDMLVRRQFAGWPLKEELLRKAMAELNPKVLPNAANSLLKRGSTLTLPTTEDLRRTLVPSVCAPTPLGALPLTWPSRHDHRGRNRPP